MSDLEAVLKQAQQLGEAIVAQPEVQAFLAAQQRLRGDEEAQQMLMEYQGVAEQVQKLQATNQPIEPDLKQQLAACEGKMASQDTLKDMMRAQADYLEVMGKINQAMEGPLARASAPGAGGA